MKLEGMKKEQIIAYNYLFTDAHINELTLEQTLRHLERNKNNHASKHQDTNRIKEHIERNFQSYKENPFIASSYAEIRDRIK